MKVAIYVEGITEAGFVYQCIKEHYQNNWMSFRLECLNLDPADAANDLRDYGDATAPDYFLIYDSCSDESVSSDIRDRYEGHRKEGFDKVIGLRDIYSERYIELFGRKHLVRKEVEVFVKEMRQAVINDENHELVRLQFAIMEIEAWMLAISDVFAQIDNRINAQWLAERVQFDVNADTETTLIHPYAKLLDIYRSISRTYGKHWSEIKEIMFKLKQKDFDRLYNSGRCNSFKEFMDVLFN